MKGLNYNNVSADDTDPGKIELSMKKVDSKEDTFVDIPLGSRIEMKEADEEIGQVNQKDNNVKVISQDKKVIVNDEDSSSKKFSPCGRFLMLYCSVVLAFTLIPALIFYILQAPIVFLLRRFIIKEGCHAFFPEGTYENIKGKLLHVLKTPYRWFMIAYEGEGEICEPFP